MLKDYFTADDVAQILKIYEVSARELLDGIIPFEADELLELSHASGVSVNVLLEGEGPETKPLN